MLSEFRSTNITWDKATSRIYSPVTANESDENGRKLVVQIVNGGQVEDLTGATLHLYWETMDKLHDGLDVFKAVDLKKGEFELSYTTGMLSNQGALNANLVLIDTVGRVVSERFKITVIEGIDDDAIQSENSFSSLTQALIDIGNLEQNYAPRLNDLTAQLQQKVSKSDFYINVKDFGAKGDGVTDDTVAIQEAIDSVGRDGATIYFPNGTYNVNSAINLLNTTIRETNRLVLLGETFRAVKISQTNNTSPHTLKFDNGAGTGTNAFGPNSHKITIENIDVWANGWTDWNTGTAIYLNGANNTSLHNVYIERFNEGIYMKDGWINDINNVRVNLATKGFTIGSSSFSMQLIKLQLTMCSRTKEGVDRDNGYALKVSRSGSLDFIGLLLEENDGIGVILDNVTAVNFVGGSVESNQYKYAFEIGSSDYNDPNYGNKEINSEGYTQGVKFSGIRFWNSNGFLFKRGCQNVTIENCAWIFPDYYTPYSYPCINTELTNDFYKYCKNLEYNNNTFPEGFEPIWHTSTDEPRGYTIYSFTKDGRKETRTNLTALNALPVTTEGFWENGQIIYGINQEVMGVFLFCYFNTATIKGFKQIPTQVFTDM